MEYPSWASRAGDGAGGGPAETSPHPVSVRRVTTAQLAELGGQMRYDRFAKDFAERLSEAGARHQPAPRARRARIAGAAAVLAASAVVWGRCTRRRTCSRRPRLRPAPRRSSRTTSGPPRTSPTVPGPQGELGPVRQRRPVERAQAQAAAVPSTPPPGPWQLIGPSQHRRPRRRPRGRQPARRTRSTSPPSGGGVWKSTDGGVNFTPGVAERRRRRRWARSPRAPTARCGPAPARRTRPAAA